MAATADSFIPLVLDERWISAIPLVAPLALRGMMHALTSNVFYVYLAIGKPQFATLALTVRALLLLPLIWVGLERGGVEGAAWAFAASMLLNIPIHLWILRRELDVKAPWVLARLARPLLAASLMYAVVRWLSASWEAPALAGDALLRLMVLVAVGASLYVSGLLLLWLAGGRPDGAEQTVVDALDSAWKRVRGRASRDESSP